MFEVGRVVVKIAGRDAGLKGVIVDVLDNTYVLIDGQVRRRKCNVLHIEPLDKVLKIAKNASHEDVAKVLKSEGIEVVEKKKKGPKSERPMKARKSKVQEAKTEEPKKAKKKPAKK
jgi:large subunit ribosomal protein L14e